VGGVTYARRVDANHPAIVKGLRKIGAGVTSMARLGGGVSDLLVSFRQRWYVMEVKAEDGVLSNDQKTWIGEQHAPVYTIRSLDEAVSFLTQQTPDWLLGLEVKAMNAHTNICRDEPDRHKHAGANPLHGELKDRVLQSLRSSWRASVKLSSGELYISLGASRTAKNLERALRSLIQDGLVKREGNNRNARYWAEEPK
jgi:hypothetical protein